MRKQDGSRSAWVSTRRQCCSIRAKVLRMCSPRNSQQDESWFVILWSGTFLDADTMSTGELQVGSQVNLERAMGAGARYGGHFVQGHVDFTCTIASITPDGTSLRFIFSIPPEGREYLTALLPKGYVTLDGTSLTLTSVDDKKGEFGIMLIEHSRKMVILGEKKVGEKVNVEIDTVAKGVEKVVSKMLSGEGGGALEPLVERMVRKVMQEKGL